jgi:hypothetical protein
VGRSRGWLGRDYPVRGCARQQTMVTYQRSLCVKACGVIVSNPFEERAHDHHPVSERAAIHHGSHWVLWT